MAVVWIKTEVWCEPRLRVGPEHSIGGILSDSRYPVGCYRNTALHVLTVGQIGAAGDQLAVFHKVAPRLTSILTNACPRAIGKIHRHLQAALRPPAEFHLDLVRGKIVFCQNLRGRTALDEQQGGG